MSYTPQRDTLRVEQAAILRHHHYEGAQHTLRLQAPQIAALAQPGSFVHLQCHPQRPLRRPISIMRVDAAAGWIDLLYKVFGEGTAQLATRQVGETLDLIGPIGRPFTLDERHPRPLLIGGGVGLPPMVFIADAIRQHHRHFKPLAILGSEVPFPFTVEPSKLLVAGIPTEVIATMPLLESWSIPTRLASKQGFAGCFEGFVTDLARLWLDSLTAEQRQEVMIYSCGPHPMLAAVAALAKAYQLPCQVSLEEYMACGVGGCAGCVVEVREPNGVAMRRVCVDGPVFDAAQIF